MQTKPMMMPSQNLTGGKSPMIDGSMGGGGMPSLQELLAAIDGRPSGGITGDSAAQIMRGGAGMQGAIGNSETLGGGMNQGGDLTGSAAGNILSGGRAGVGGGGAHPEGLTRQIDSGAGGPDVASMRTNVTGGSMTALPFPVPGGAPPPMPSPNMTGGPSPLDMPKPMKSPLLQTGGASPFPMPQGPMTGGPSPMENPLGRGATMQPPPGRVPMGGLPGMSMNQGQPSARRQQLAQLLARYRGAKR